MLILDSSKRLSIDIDIIIEKEPEDLEKIFNILLEPQGFIKFELQERKAATSIQKAHYKFFYKPVHQTQAEGESILLDILFEKVGYKKIEENWEWHPTPFPRSASYSFTSLPLFSSRSGWSWRQKS